MARAFEMVVSGDKMSAQEAYHAGQLLIERFSLNIVLIYYSLVFAFAFLVKLFEIKTSQWKLIMLHKSNYRWVLAWLIPLSAVSAACSFNVNGMVPMATRFYCT